MKVKKLKSIKYTLILLLLTFFVSCWDKIPIPKHSDFNIGTARDEITAQFGEPTRTQIFTKQGQPIWGAIEGYWDEVPEGSTIEVWAYPSTIEYQDADEIHVQEGETELYFLDNSKTVSAKGFHIAGADYEVR